MYPTASLRFEIDSFFIAAANWSLLFLPTLGFFDVSALNFIIKLSDRINLIFAQEIRWQFRDIR